MQSSLLDPITVTRTRPLHFYLIFYKKNFLFLKFLSFFYIFFLQLQQHFCMTYSSHCNFITFSVQFYPKMERKREGNWKLEKHVKLFWQPQPYWTANNSRKRRRRGRYKINATISMKTFSPNSCWCKRHICIQTYTYDVNNMKE